jgi:hypothetical protein
MHARKGVKDPIKPSFITSLFEITSLDDKSAAEMMKLADRMMEIVVQGRKTGNGRRYRISLMASPIV